MHWRPDQLERYVSTAMSIADSPSVEQIIIGFTAQSSQARFRPYESIGEYEHIAILCDGLSRKDALDLERHLFVKGVQGDQAEVLYQKYDPTRRNLAYSPSYGGKGDPAATTHKVYMVWWSP